MELTTKIANSSNYTKGRTKNIKYIVIHYTANVADKALSNANYFHNNVLNASAHYFVDETSIYQSVLDTDTAWHCGTSGTYLHAYCRNTNSIGVEMCSDKVDGMYVITADTITNTVGLVKMLMHKYGILIDNVIRHADVTGKNCPEPFVREPAQWENFKELLTESEEKIVKIKDISILNLDNNYEFTVKGNTVDNTNYVGIRDLLTKLGYTVGWEKGKVTIKK